MPQFYPLPTSEVYVSVPPLSERRKKAFEVSAVPVRMGVKVGLTESAACLVQDWTQPSLSQRAGSNLESEREEESDEDRQPASYPSMKDFIVKDEVIRFLWILTGD